MSAYVLLGLLVVLTISSSIAYKVASSRLDHNTAPIYTSLWVIIGLLLVFPAFKQLFFDGLITIKVAPFLLLLLLAKGIFLWALFYNRLILTEKSLSAGIYFLPTALGFIAVINSFLGEQLKTLEWVVALGLCFLGGAFALRGHLQELGFQGRILFFKLVAISIVLATLDQLILTETNWYILLLITNIFMLGVCFVRKLSIETWRSALLRKEAFLAGSVFSVGELFKFYLMVSILPMSVVISAQVATIPVVLILSALIWGERSWKEQFLWGILSTGLLLLLFL